MWKVKYVQQCFYLVNELYARTQYDERKECAAQCSLQDMNLMGSTHESHGSFVLSKSGSVSGGGPVKEIKRVYHSAVRIIII